MKKVQYFEHVTIQDFEEYYQLKALGLEQYVIISVMSGDLSKDDAVRQMVEEDKRREEHAKRVFKMEDCIPF